MFKLAKWECVGGPSGTNTNGRDQWATNQEVKQKANKHLAGTGDWPERQPCSVPTHPLITFCSSGVGLAAAAEDSGPPGPRGEAFPGPDGMCSPSSKLWVHHRVSSQLDQSGRQP